MRLLLLLLQLSLCLATAGAQSLWDEAHLAYAKAHGQQPAFAAAISHLMGDADRALMAVPPSVMQKKTTAASGDRHDYTSLSRYFWPDPTKPDGLPYVNRDGRTNPEIDKYDRNRLSEMTDGVITLALAWYFTERNDYAQKAAELLRTWFLNKETRMNPHLHYAQMVPGVNDGRGRCYGLIDSYSFVEMLSAVKLLEQSEAFTRCDARQLKAWFAQFLQWMLTSEQGREEDRQANNHSVAYDVQLLCYALYTDNKEVARQLTDSFPSRRLQRQIAADGSQPHELWRTLAFGYSEYNLQHCIDFCQLARQVSAMPMLAPLEKAADYLAQYLGKDVQAWPHQQISDWEGKQQELCRDLYRLWLLDGQREDYRQLVSQHLVKQMDNRFFLLYYRPTVADQAFAAADVQLCFQMEQVKAARTKSPGTMPRSVNADGTLRMVGIGDWCSGFYPGLLWQMYQWSHDDFWRRQAVGETWRLQDNQWNASSHDLGFMMHIPFGTAWRLTGERSYRDVVVQAARTLATRFDERVGCIRSWSWGTPERWRFAVIIDNMMNLELLFEAARLTGDQQLRRMAESHADKTLQNHFRPDGSSYHVVDYNPDDGTVIKRITHQGLADESVWSRGQAWGLYGFTMCYRYTRQPSYLEQAQRIADFFFNQHNLSADLIPYWDMRDPAIPQAPRDASAAAIFASGLYELATYSAPSLAARYRDTADRIVASLHDAYQPQPRTAQGFLLLHSTGNHPANDEIDVPIGYADYYYLEALQRRETMK